MCENRTENRYTSNFNLKTGFMVFRLKLLVGFPLGQNFEIFHECVARSEKSKVMNDSLDGLNYVGFSIVKNFEHFSNKKVMKKNTKVMADSTVPHETEGIVTCVTDECVYLK